VYRVSLQFRKALSWKQFEAGGVEVSHKFSLFLLSPGQITPALVYSGELGQKCRRAARAAGAW